MKPIKWKDIKIGQAYFTSKHPYVKLIKKGNMAIGFHALDGSFKERELGAISKADHFLWTDDKIKRMAACRRVKA